MRVPPSHARWHGFLFLAITSIGWGLNWPAIKILLRDWPPLFSRGVAGVAAAVILAAIATARRDSLAVPRGTMPTLLFASFTNVFAWMGFGTMAMKYLSISEAALLVYTMPIWAMLFAWPLRGARPSVRDTAAPVLGVCGMAILFGGHGFAFGADKIFGMALALASATLFALGSVLAKGPLPMPPLSAVAWQAGLGCLPMIVLGWTFERPDLNALSRLRFRRSRLHGAGADGRVLPRMVRGAETIAGGHRRHGHADGADPGRRFRRAVSRRSARLARTRRRRAHADRRWPRVAKQAGGMIPQTIIPIEATAIFPPSP